MIRFFGRLFLFLLISAGIKWLLLCLTDPFKPSAGSWDEKVRQLNTFGESTNTVLIGSSRTNTALDPAYFDSLTNQTHAVNFGVNGLFMPYTADLCEEVIAHPTSGVRYILFELSLPTDPLDPFQGKPLEDARFFWDYEFASLSRKTTDVDNPLSVRLNDQVYYVLSPARILTLGLGSIVKKKLWRAVKQALGMDKPQRLSDVALVDNGYVRDTRQFSEKSATLAATHAHGLRIYQDAPLPLNPAYTFYLEKINTLHQLATAEGIKLYFYLPNRMSAEEAEVLPAVFRQLTVDQRLSVVYDARFDLLFDPLYSTEERHLNDKGARVYTSLMAEAFCRQVRCDP